MALKRMVTSEVHKSQTYLIYFLTLCSSLKKKFHYYSKAAALEPCFVNL